LAHYAGTAAAAIAIPLVGLVASFRAPGSRLSVWCAGLGAVVLGTAGLVFPTQSSSIGNLWGATAVAWGIAFSVVGELGATRRRSASSPAKDSAASRSSATSWS
ncbi:MAG TPA: hypothetical protein VE915_02915, partial [Actinomycetota bacterium]|nr:hypothetical protein [Actinomycetota bacterium]